MNIVTNITLNLLSGGSVIRLFLVLPFGAYSSIPVSSFCLTLRVCFYLLGKLVPSPCLEGVPFFRRYPVELRNNIPLGHLHQELRVWGVPLYELHVPACCGGATAGAQECVGMLPSPAALCYSGAGVGRALIWPGCGMEVGRALSSGYPPVPTGLRRSSKMVPANKLEYDFKNDSYPCLYPWRVLSKFLPLWQSLHDE